MTAPVKQYPAKGELPEQYTDVICMFEGLPHPTNEELLLTPDRLLVRQYYDDIDGGFWIDGSDENADVEDDAPDWWTPMPVDQDTVTEST